MRKEGLAKFIITFGYKETSVISQTNTNPEFSHSSWLNPYLIGHAFRGLAVITTATEVIYMEILHSVLPPKGIGPR